MGEELRSYCLSLINDVPYEVYVILLFIFCLGSLILIVLRGVSYRDVARLFLLEYLFLIYCSTVFFRDMQAERQYTFTPFWSYERISNGDTTGLLVVNIMNVMVFVPIGMLAEVAFRGMTWKKVLVIGLGLSVGIEVLQFVFRKGLSEVDDVIHNTFGCLIGYVLWLLLKTIGRCSLNYCK